MDMTTQQQSYLADRRTCAEDDLRRLLDAEIASDGHTGMTNVLDMLAGLAEEKSQLEGDKWERIAQAIARLAVVIEHHIPDDPKDDDYVPFDQREPDPCDLARDRAIEQSEAA